MSVSKMEEGKVFVVSGPSGSGKGTVIGILQEIYTGMEVAVSATTRAPREGEAEGVNYFYLTKEEFEEKIQKNYFLEYAMYADNYYGTSKEKVQEKLDQGIDVILVIEIQGARKIKELVPEAIFIFIMPPDEKELLKRLKNRKTESKEKILERFNIAYKEMNEVTKYNYVVVNDDIEKAVSKVEAIIKAEKCRVDRIEEMLVANKEEIIHEFLMEEDFINNPISIDK